MLPSESDVQNALREIRAAHGGPHADRPRRELASFRLTLDRDLARVRGWTVSGARFELDDLRYGRSVDPGSARKAGLLGEVVRFALLSRGGLGRGTPAAMLSHSYILDLADHEAYARAMTLDVEFLEWSWYDPDECLAVLYKRRFPTDSEDDAMTLAAISRVSAQLRRPVGLRHLTGGPPDGRLRESVARLETAGAIVRAPAGGLPRGVRGPAWTVAS